MSRPPCSPLATPSPQRWKRPGRSRTAGASCETARPHSKKATGSMPARAEEPHALEERRVIARPGVPAFARAVPAQRIRPSS